MLNRIRNGSHTKEDMEELQLRVRPENHPDVVSADMYIGCKRKDVAATNGKYIRKLKGKARVMYAKHHHPTIKKYKPKIEAKDDSVATTAFQRELTLKIGAKVMIIYNIDVSDMLVNGMLGTLEDIVDTKDGKVDKLILRLRDPKAGRENRNKYSQLAAKYPECVVIERVSVSYTLRKKGGVASSQATVIQFPVRLSYATTSHKIQGQTIPHPMKVAMNLESVFQPAQAYVMLSRIQSIDQLFIVGKLNPEKIKTASIGLRECQRLEEISENRNPSEWNSVQCSNKLKVASLNCAGLLVHLRDMKADQKLLKADIINLQETSIEENHSVPELENHRIDVPGRGKGKGAAMIVRKDLGGKVDRICERNLQIMKLELENLDVINVYRSSDKSLVQTAEQLRDFLNTDKSTLITGDFNVCYKGNRNNQITKTLERMGFKQLVREATQIQGGLIDHVYWKDSTQSWDTPVLERYSPYYSDHDALLVVLER